MTGKADWIVVVTYREWLTWAACGALRIGEGRRTKLGKRDPVSSGEAFGKLMDKAPDVSRWEDQAYLVAYLRRTPPGCDGGKLVDLKLVTGFHPLSARGHALLKGDAERALVKLGEPVYEDRWRDWVAANRRTSRETSARRLVEACGLPVVGPNADVDLDLLLEPLTALQDRVNEREAVRFDRKMRQGGKLARQPAYGWWLALTVFKSRLPEDVAEAFTTEVKAFIDRSFDEMKSVDAFTRPVTSWRAATAFATTMIDRFSDDPDPSLTMMAVIHHYQHAITEFGAVDYDALGEDLRYLQDGQGERGVETAALAAWCIGWHLDSATATALRCAAVPSESSAVLDLDRVPRIPAVPGRQDMCERAANDDVVLSAGSAAGTAAGA